MEGLQPFVDPEKVEAKVIKDIGVYERVRFLGKGQYGKVYLVKKGSKKYALKELDDVEIKDYSREISSLSMLQFPSILSLVGFTYPEDRQAFIVTEYVPKGDLTDIIKSEYKLKGAKKQAPPEWTITKKFIVLYGIAKGMSYVHKFDIMHRDLKPDNILLNENYEPKIADFGFSKFADSESAVLHTMQIGTILYEAPEVILYDTYNTKVDVYSFAIIACYMFSGKVPHENEKQMDVLINIEKADRDESLLEGMPTGVQALIEACWDQEPNNRPTFDIIVEQLALKEFFDDVPDLDFDEYFEYVNRLENYNPDEQQDTEDSASISEEIEEPSTSENLPTTEEPKEVASNISQIATNQDFEILNQIASGEFCIVYHVRDKSEEYVMKEINKYDSKQFILEMGALTKLDFPSVLGIKWFSFPYREESKPAFLSCDFVPNGELESMIQKSIDQEAPQEWDLTKKMIVIYGIAKGMEHCHQNNILHRNLNPENILLDVNYEPIITGHDFQKFANPIVEGYGTCLTVRVPFFTAPEKLANQEYNEKVDVYSFGIIVYYLLVGRHPFENLNMVNFISRVTNGQRDEIPDDVQKEYHQLIRDCWDNSPGLRPSFKDIVDFLSHPNNYLQGIDVNEYEEYMKRLNNYTSQRQHENIATVMKKYMRKSPIEEISDPEIADIISHMLHCDVNKLLRKGKVYEEANKMKKAADCYRQVAEADDPRGQFHYGRLLSIGNGVKRSLLQAAFFFRLASESTQYPDFALKSLILLGKVYEEMGDYKAALDSYQSAMDRASNVGKVNYARLLGDESLPGIQHDTTKSLSLLNELVDEKDSFALYVLGKLYMEGKNGLPKDEKKGVELLRESSELESPEGQYEFGMCLLNGTGVPRDLKAARKLIEKSSSKNNLDAYYALARIYKEGLGVKKDFSTAVTLLDNAAKNGLIKAGFQAGMYYLDKGKFKSAYKSFKSASEFGDADASFQFAMLLKEGKGCSDKKPEVERAAEILKELSDSLGYTDAMRELGLIHLKKLMKYTSPKIAFRYLEKAASLGDSVAQFNLGTMYEDGKAIQQDIEKAKYYYNLAAAKGNAEAKARIASL